MNLEEAWDFANPGSHGPPVLVESRQQAACWLISPVNSAAVTTDSTAVPLLAV